MVEPHARSTRLVHTGLALSICSQLATSLFMQGPTGNAPGDTIFELHRYSGFAALSFALLFWLVLASRQRGTDAAALFPWVSADRRRAVLADLSAHVRDMLKLQFPPRQDAGPLASAVHGLGLLLMTAMAASGAVYAFQVWIGAQSPEPEGSLAMTVHFALANLVWVYLIAHAGMATLHHVTRTGSLARMWRLKP